MKATGIAFLVLAALALIFGFSVDTTVATGLGGRVNNIGLMNDRQNVILMAVAVAMAMAIVGAVFFGFVSRANAPVSSVTAPSNSIRACPYCAETIKAEAVVCRFCNRDVAPTAATKPDLLFNGRKEVEPDADTMALHGITFDGERYHFGQYKYEKYSDALAYAKLQSPQAQA